MSIPPLYRRICSLYFLPTPRSCPQVDRSIPINPHPDEVDAVKWVSVKEMDAMMDDPGALSRPVGASLGGERERTRFLRRTRGAAKAFLPLAHVICLSPPIRVHSVEVTF